MAEIDAVEPSNRISSTGIEFVRYAINPSDLAGIGSLRHVILEENELGDAEQIALGTYAPLAGFMDRACLNSVLNEYCLPEGDAWTLPIVLPVLPDIAARLSPGQRVALCDSAGSIYSVLDITEIYPVDIESLLMPWFGTASSNHPGVAKLLSRGRHFIAGDVKLVRRLPRSFPDYDFPPEQLREIFRRRNWTRVVGFHGRNLVHRGHEHIQLSALRLSGADGLYINPVVGHAKSGDFLPHLILAGYQAMVDHGHYPASQVAIGCFSTYPRYCGPREAVFTALCRKNMGCTHFIIGRDHTGVGGFYGPDDGRRLFERLGNIGIEPIFFDAVGYDPELDRYVPDTADGRVLPISGTAIRDALVAGRNVPEWMMRQIVQEVMHRELAAGRPIFRK